MMKKRSTLAVLLAVAALAGLLALLFLQTLSPGSRYEKAEKLLELGEYEAALRDFIALGDYRDSAARAAEAREALAGTRDEETPGEPEEHHTAAEPEHQSGAAELEARNAAAYAQAEALLRAEDYAGAMAAFEALGDYRDSAARAEEAREVLAEAQRETEREARNAAAYAEAEALLRSEDYTSAIAAFEALGEYRDSAARAEEAREVLAEAQRKAELEARNAAAYAEAEGLLRSEDYAGAMAAFDALGDYMDSPARAAEAREALDATPYGKALARAAELGLPTPPEIDVGSWEFTLVNGEHSIDRYEPEQLAYLNLTLADTEIRTAYDGGRQVVDLRIAEPLIAFCQGCRDAGLSVYLSSGYRSYSDQAANFQRICQNNGVSDGKDGAGHYITMPPGCSEHQLALCCDITDRYYQIKSASMVEPTETFQWLNAHCAEYGFILRFPAGKEDITGVMYEPWHFRYVGQEAARYITENQLCLEEFLALYGVE